MTKRIMLFLLLLLLVGFMAAQSMVAKQPDLVISAIEIDPADPKPGDMLTITADVLNQGQGDVTGQFNVKLVISFGPPELSWLGLGEFGGMGVATQRVSDLKAGATKQVVFHWQMIELPVVKIIVIADYPFNQVQESNEKNNRREYMLQLDSRYVDQWWLKEIDVAPGWKVTRGSPSVVVAVIDSGIDYSQPELKDKLWTNPHEIPDNGVDDDHNGYVDDVHGWDFVDNDNDPLKGSPINPHGTAVAGLIGAADDGKGTTGVAPGVKLMDLRVLDKRGEGHTDDLVQAIKYAVENGAKIINLSLGLPYDVPRQDREWLERELQPIFVAAANYGVLVIAAAGNEGAAVGWPARFPSVIAVAAVTKDEQETDYSNYGPEIDVAAPGGSLSWSEFLTKASQAHSFAELLPVVNDLLIAPYPRDYYGWVAGTSAATPLVSGTIALLCSLDPSLTLDQVRDILAHTSQDLGPLGRDEHFGYGLIDAGRAVEYLRRHRQ